MAAVSVIARNLHTGHLERLPLRNRSVGTELRPLCDSCGWKGPRYALADEMVAQVGLDAHIATADSGGDNWLYEVCIYLTLNKPCSRTWDWETLAWQ